ncbi:MAG: DNA repair protein RecO, partial [Phycisphaerae bacterium]|nr:DNA repair protein RecO [Phycisphaerae bacterium]
MAILSDTAICMRCWDYSETSQTVSLLTKEYGIIRGIAKGSKRNNGSFSGGFDPLTRGHIVARIKASSDLATLTEWQLEHVWWSTRNSLQVNKASIYMADLVGRLINDQDPHTNVF